MTNTTYITRPIETTHQGEFYEIEAGTEVRVAILNENDIEIETTEGVRASVQPMDLAEVLEEVAFEGVTTEWIFTFVDDMDYEIPADVPVLVRYNTNNEYEIEDIETGATALVFSEDLHKVVQVDNEENA